MKSIYIDSVPLYLELLKGKDMDWQESQHTDFLAWEHEAEEVLKATAFRPLTEDERHLLAWAMGKQNIFQERDKRGVQLVDGRTRRRWPAVSQK